MELEIIGGPYAPPPAGMRCAKGPAGIGLNNSFWAKVCFHEVKGERGSMNLLEMHERRAG